MRYGIFIIAVMIFLVGCSNSEPDSRPVVSENVVAETGQEKESDTMVSENKPEISLVYVENYLEEEGEIVDFLKEYFMISSKEDLEVLTQLPLSESFFNSCVNDFEYLNEADETGFVYVAAWLATEENVYECLVRTYDREYKPATNYWNDGERLCAYSVKITLAGNQIDQVSVETIGWNGDSHTEETDRREYTQEELAAAWESRHGDYGILLAEFPEITIYDEVFAVRHYMGYTDNQLTIHSIRMEEAKYASVNAGLAELIEEIRMYYDSRKLYGDKTTELIVCRLDGRVISIKNSEYLPISNTATLDMVTGEKLACAEIFADAKTAEAVIAEKLAAELHSCNAGNRMIRNAESFSLESMAGYQWYLDGEGVVITVGVEGGTPHSITLSYREYAYLFQPQYLPGDGIAYYRSNNTGTDHIEFNGVIAEDMELSGSNSSYDYSDVVGYYINDGTEEYICISVQGVNEDKSRFYLCGMKENEMEVLAESEEIRGFFSPQELREWIKTLL